MTAAEKGTLLIEEEVVEEDASCLEKFLAHQATRIIMFIIWVGYGLFAVIFDWLWVADMLNTEKALVFGPPDTDILATLITVASIGTVVYALEITNMVMKECCGKPLMPEELAELLSLFVEEVPQITLSALLASCREVPMSYYQLVKAALAMFSSVFRTVKVLSRYFTVRRRGEETGCWRWLVRTLILAACVYIMIASILVWVFTYSDTTPENVYSKSYDDARYLYKSGIYFSHPFFWACNNNSLPWNETRHNWVKMEGIYEVKDSNDYQFNFHFNDSHAFTYVHNVMKNGTNLNFCYETNFQDCGTKRVEYSCENLNYPTTISIMLGSKDKTKTRVFGDITYKAFIRNNGTCEHMETDHVGFFRKSSSPEIFGQFQYFRVLEKIDDRYSFYSNNTLRPYVYQQDTQNVTDVWKTGYNECDMSGSLVPNLDNKLPLYCS